MSAVLDLLVVGAGPAGVEAACRVAQKGLRVRLISASLDHLCRLEGLGAFPPDQTRQALTLQRALWPEVEAASLLGEAFGLAVLDRRAVGLTYKSLCETHAGVETYQGMVSAVKLLPEGSFSLQTHLGERFKARSVLLTVGTFLGAELHEPGVPAGLKNTGRRGESGSERLRESLEGLGLSFQTAQAGCGPTVRGEFLHDGAFTPHALAGNQPGPAVYQDEKGTLFWPADRQGLTYSTRAGEGSDSLPAKAVIRPGYQVSYLTAQRRSDGSCPVPGLFISGALGGTQGYLQAALDGVLTADSTAQWLAAG